MKGASCTSTHLPSAGKVKGTISAVMLSPAVSLARECCFLSLASDTWNIFNHLCIYIGCRKTRGGCQGHHSQQKCRMYPVVLLSYWCTCVWEPFSWLSGAFLHIHDRECRVGALLPLHLHILCVCVARSKKYVSFTFLYY